MQDRVQAPLQVALPINNLLNNNDQKSITISKFAIEVDF